MAELEEEDEGALVIGALEDATLLEAMLLTIELEARVLEEMMLLDADELLAVKVMFLSAENGSPLPLSDVRVTR